MQSALIRQNTNNYVLFLTSINHCDCDCKKWFGHWELPEPFTKSVIPESRLNISPLAPGVRRCTWMREQASVTDNKTLGASLHST